MSDRKVEWGFYDRNADIVESSRLLPHRDQPGALTFVTFRLADSMPKLVVAQWHHEIEQWLGQNGLAGSTVAQVIESTTVSASLKRELRRFKHRRWHCHLDDCHGACLLKNPECRAEVCKSILHFNGDKYDTERFVVMPYHVHVLIQMRHDFALRKQFREIQRYSARQINKLRGRSGDLWQGEPFDHIVRSEDQLAYLQHYILENPAKGRVPVGEYSYWQHDQ